MKCIRHQSLIDMEMIFRIRFSSIYWKIQSTPLLGELCPEYVATHAANKVLVFLFTPTLKWISSNQIMDITVAKL